MRVQPWKVVVEGPRLRWSIEAAATEVDHGVVAERVALVFSPGREV